MTTPTPKRPPGRPRLPAAERRVRCDLTLSAAALAVLDTMVDELGGTRSAHVERLVKEEVERGMRPAGARRRAK